MGAFDFRFEDVPLAVRSGDAQQVIALIAGRCEINFAAHEYTVSEIVLSSPMRDQPDVPVPHRGAGQTGHELWKMVAESIASGCEDDIQTRIAEVEAERKRGTS